MFLCWRDAERRAAHDGRSFPGAVAEHEQRLEAPVAMGSRPTTRISRAGARLDLGQPDPHDSATVLRVDGRLFIDTTDGRRLLATAATLGLAFGHGQSERVDDRPTCDVIEQDIESLVGRDPR